MKATNVAFILVFWVVGTLADPETVKGLLKKNTNSWNVPIVAKQANENNPTQVVGGYPKLELDTLARPLKSGEITFHFFLTEAPSQSAPTILVYQVGLIFFWVCNFRPFFSGSQTDPCFQNKNSGCRLTGRVWHIFTIPNTTK